MKMNAWTILLVTIAVALLILLVSRNTHTNSEGYAKLDGGFGGGYNHDSQTETCYS